MNKSKIMRAVLMAVLTLVATTASAHSFEVDGIYYNKNSDGTVSVTFKGSSSSQYANEYTGDVIFHLLLPIPERPIPLLQLAILPSRTVAA